MNLIFRPLRPSEGRHPFLRGVTRNEQSVAILPSRWFVYLGGHAPDNLFMNVWEKLRRSKRCHPCVSIVWSGLFFRSMTLQETAASFEAASVTPPTQRDAVWVRSCVKIKSNDLRPISLTNSVRTEELCASSPNVRLAGLKMNHKVISLSCCEAATVANVAGYSPE